MRSDELADFLELLAATVRDLGEALFVEMDRIRDEVDERWHIDPAATGQASLSSAAKRLDIPADHLAAIIRANGSLGG